MHGDEARERLIAAYAEAIARDVRSLKHHADTAGGSRSSCNTASSCIAGLAERIELLANDIQGLAAEALGVKS